MPTLFSPKRDYWTWARQRMPLVLELTKLGFTREEIAQAMQASVSTIQRDLYELRLRRMIPETPIKWDQETQKQLVHSTLAKLKQLSRENAIQPKHHQLLCEILHTWLQHQKTDRQGQSPLPLPKENKTKSPG